MAHSSGEGRTPTLLDTTSDKDMRRRRQILPKMLAGAVQAVGFVSGASPSRLPGRNERGERHGPPCWTAETATAAARKPRPTRRGKAVPLLRAVIDTVDRHGLRRQHLQKHSREVERYFDRLAGRTFSSEAAQALQARLRRSRGRLFTFIEHDGVPWNNNNAENAVKRFAYYREVAQSPLYEEG
jgi:hypothetical protein